MDNAGAVANSAHPAAMSAVRSVAGLDSSNAPMRAGGPEALGWILLVLLMVLLGEGALAWWSGRPA